MSCEFNYCVFNKELFCLLDEIGINGCGMCSELMLASIPDDELESMKEKHLKELEE